MHNMDGVPEPRYLTAERTVAELGDAVLNEFRVAKEVREQFGDSELASYSLSQEGYMDLALSQRIVSWTRSKGKIDRHTRRHASRMFDTYEQSTQARVLANHEFIQEHGFEYSVAVAGITSEFTIRNTDPQNWKPRIAEVFGRFGLRNAVQPLRRDLLTRRYQPYTDPDQALVTEALLRTACTAEALLVMSALYQRLSAGKRKPGVRQYMRSLTGGLVLEYDGLVYLYEREPDQYYAPGHGLWHLPAPLNMDINPIGKNKADLMTIHLSNQKCNGAITLYDVKSKESRPKPRKKSSRPEASEDSSVGILSASQIGCTALGRNGRIEIVPGTRCQDYLDRYTEELEDERVVSREARFAWGLAIAGSSLDNLHDVYKSRKV